MNELTNCANDLNREGCSLLSGLTVQYTFRPHVTVSIDSGEHGIKHLIAKILIDSGCVCDASESNREVLIVNSMTSEEIISNVRTMFGWDRYPDNTIHMYVSVFMIREGMVGKFRMTKDEDSERKCKVPRCRFFVRKDYLEK
jgi:hypothetical protein